MTARGFKKSVIDQIPDIWKIQIERSPCLDFWELQTIFAELVFLIWEAVPEKRRKWKYWQNYVVVSRLPQRQLTTTPTLQYAQQEQKESIESMKKHVIISIWLCFQSGWICPWPPLLVLQKTKLPYLAPIHYTP